MFKLKIFLFLFVISPAIVFAGDKQEKSNNILVAFYQNHISKIDGSRCPMHPSCSSYFQQAFKKHNFMIATIMTFDRLLRCGGDELKFSSIIEIESNKKRCFDPVAHNDFWWD